MFGWLRKTLRQARFGAPVIVVSGLPRSGTSMMMKMLAAGGVELVTDEARAADEDNPRGYFEDARVKELERADDRGWLQGCRGKAVKIISFLLKDLPQDNAYRILFMRRNLDEVIVSQNKMLERRGEADGAADDDRLRKLYEQHLRKVELLLRERRDFESLDVPYREALARPREHVERIARFLELDLDVERMTAAVEPDLYRNRR